MASRPTWLLLLWGASFAAALFVKRRSGALSDWSLLALTLAAGAVATLLYGMVLLTWARV